MPFKDCIEACFSCSASCEQCATECLEENELKTMSACITLNRECALVCASAAQLMAIGSENATALCHACINLCGACAEECEKHSDNDHCRRCAEACRRCAEVCEDVLQQQAA